MLIALVTPAQAVHEIGHGLICSANGFEYDMSVDIFGAYTVCYGDIGENLMYRAFGGFLASMVFIAPLIHTRLRNTPWVLIPLSSIAFGHLVNAFIETFAYESYIAGDAIWSGVLMMSSYAVFIGLLIKYGRTLHGPTC